jgi:hypothetical protein
VRITEAENALPNGFHDADLLNCVIDYEHDRATLVFNADFSEHPQREPEYRKVALLIEGLRFVSIPAPQPDYRPRRKNPWVLGFEAWRNDLEVDEELKKTVLALEPEVFCEWTFVTNWNRFIVIAAQSARIEIGK